MKPLNIINPMYSLYTQLNLVQFHLKLMSAVSKALKPGKIRIIFSPAPPEHGAFHKFILETSLQRWVPDHLLEAGDHAEIQEARRTTDRVCQAVLRDFHGDWSLSIPEHHCSGAECCSSPETTSRKMTHSILAIQQLCVTGCLLPRENQWFKLLASLAPWAFGTVCHRLFPRIFAAGCNAKPKPGEDLEVRESDDIKN